LAECDPVPAGGYFPVPVARESIHKVRQWCAENCAGD
jgi:hypothetical protein